MYYNVRDLIGHWVKPRSRQGKMCPHACCRNRRVHPDNFPVLLPAELLRRAPEKDLLYHYEHTGNDRARAQVLAEVDRREQSERARAKGREAARGRAFARQLERRELIDHEIRQAEAATNGYMVNDDGRRRGVTPESLFRGSESRALRYASDDLLRYWEDHPRPSAGLLSSNPAVIRRTRARSDIGRVDYTSTRPRPSAPPKQRGPLSAGDKLERDRAKLARAKAAAPIAARSIEQRPPVDDARAAAYDRIGRHYHITTRTVDGQTVYQVRHAPRGRASFGDVVAELRTREAANTELNRRIVERYEANRAARAQPITPLGVY